MMRRLRSLYRSAVLALYSAAALGVSQVVAQQATGRGIEPGPKDLAGIVASAHGPEAGVWVIAETTDLPTRMAKIVVTDDHGHYVVPDLPQAHYTVWVRGFDLVDSPKVQAKPGSLLDLRA